MILVLRVVSPSAIVVFILSVFRRWVEVADLSLEIQGICVDVRVTTFVLALCCEHDCVFQFSLNCSMISREICCSQRTFVGCLNSICVDIYDE